MQTAADLKQERVDGMSTARFTEHFDRIRSVCDIQNITEPTRVFNIYKCGFSMKCMMWDRCVKRIVSAGSTSCFRTLKWKGSIYPVTRMAIVNDLVQVFTPAIVILSMLASYRSSANGGLETPSDYLSKSSYVYMCPLPELTVICSSHEPFGS